MSDTRDDITRRSLSAPLLIASLLLCAAMAWAVYDEAIGQRPWKSYQNEFRTLYTGYLREQRHVVTSVDVTAGDKSAAVREMERQLVEANQAAAPRLQEIERALITIRTQLDAIMVPLRDARARVAALVYDLDHSIDGERPAIRRQIDLVRTGPFVANGDRYTLDQLEDRFTALRAEEARLVTEQSNIGSRAAALRRRRSDAIAEHTDGVTPESIDAALHRMASFAVGIRQIHVPESGVVDRCESCHLGVREPLAWSVADRRRPRLFAQHPNPELLKIHNPDRFGCSPCHNGNGAATSSADKAHGRNDGWAWPLYDREHIEAGCLQCHRQDRVLDHGSVLTRGRDLYQTKGCAACHRYAGFDREADASASARDEIRRLIQQAADQRREIPREIARGDAAATVEEARSRYARATSLRLEAATIEARITELTANASSFEQERKQVGPSLKDVRLKLRKAWIPVWLTDPQAFRPDTNMPKFRLTEQERRALAAFLWQAADAVPPLSPQPKGKPARGKDLIETRGCLGCHSIGSGDERVGDAFASNLARLGEKTSYEYLATMLHDPQARPTGTVMPDFRLSWADARDIASYLIESERIDDTYLDDVSYIDDARLAESGRVFVSRYGCANCHEIRDFDEAPRVGVELTYQGDKRVEQLDFGLLVPVARREGWHSLIGFLERKLVESAVFDRGREKAPADRLRMPDITLEPRDVKALSTFLAGSVDTPTTGALRMIPSAFRHEPDGPARDLQEGWWLVKKYNCTGCHVIDPVQASTLSSLVRYQDPDWKEKLPPVLLQEGARVNPEWLARFLENPALSVTKREGNGVRPYLDVRMPTFNFSPTEIRTLVRFFEALAGQASPYMPPRLEPLTEAERTIARALFSSQAAVCVKCHVVGVRTHDRNATAPDLLLAAERLKPAWTLRWTVQPQDLSPGTAMPANLFRLVQGRWMFTGRAPVGFERYTSDHAQLLVRYMFTLSAEEQRLLLKALPASPSTPPTADRRP